MAESLISEIEVRVRYTECDPMNVAHHSVYPVWMEMARTQWLRDRGMPYRELEEQGILFVVARMSLRYRKPARYDDVLVVRVWPVDDPNPSRVKVDQEYEIRRGDELLVTAQTTLVCVDRQGKPQAMPDQIA